MTRKKKQKKKTDITKKKTKQRKTPQACISLGDPISAAASIIKKQPGREYVEKLVEELMK